MNVIVLVQGAPDFREGKVSFKEDNTLDRSKSPTVLNPSDRIALSAALEMKVKHGGQVRVVLDTQPCVECGTCAIVAATRWDTPRGGKGVQYRWG